ncbi:uncharacterized protein LOC128920393 [Zeugodacus cucurbitae]|uniref:uncharacterized protein LOC128920393 n=1 Tax=Zeugodacus cucurbitae TaxID=28588 RepID=UPI0023D8E4CA|nr:uncharacterized protein LOC128920393 [Zeugodacus cucurbitae]XP_054083538.1 uncharacterized protein LOC128920393 [Zeugodacus cucurbitae]
MHAGRCLDPTWGLSPTLWCYTAIVRPILLYGVLVWWTGTSKSTYRKFKGKVQRLAAPNHCSIFQAEVFPIGKAAELASTAQGQYSKINIYVDSQAAIKAVTSCRISAKSVLSSRVAEMRVARNMRLHFYWVPGHKGNGNEIVDGIAKSGVQLSPGNMINIGKPMHILYDDIDRKTRHRKLISRWKDLPGCKTAKVMCKSVDQKYTRFLLELDRKGCRTMVGILTGHSLVAAHAYKMRLSDREESKKCQERGTKETVEHLLCVYPALARQRFRYLGAPQYDKLEEISLVKPRKLIKFTSGAGILNDDYYSGNT